MLTIPRYAREDLELYGTRIAKGEAVCVSAIAANRDPRVFANEVALAGLLRRFPELALAAEPGEIRAPDPGTWRGFPCTSPRKSTWARNSAQ